MSGINKRLDSFLTSTLSGPVFSWRQIIDLLVPGVLDSLSIMFINTLITALISKNGEASVAAVSLVGPITGLVTYLFSGISSGGTVIVAQCCGKKDPALIQRSITVTITLTVCIGAVVCLPFLLFPQAILQLLYPSAEPLVMEKAIIFLSGSVWSILVFTLYTAIFAVLRGLGESKRCLVLSIIINVAYLLLSILFLNVMNLDIKGSVLALFFARVIGVLAAIVYLFIWRAPFKFRIKDLIRMDPSLIKSTLKVGLPLGFEQIFMSLGNIVAEMYMIMLGTTALATHAIANSLIGLLYSPAMSVGGLSVTIVGRCIGAEEYEDAYRYGKRCNQISIFLLVAFGLIFYPLLPVLLQQYNPSPEVAEMATRLLYWSIPALILFWPKSFTMPNTLRAASDTLFPTVVSTAVLWLVNIALGYILAIPCGLGLNGTWIAMWISWAVRSTAFSLRFRGRKWLYKTKTKVD